MGKWWIALFCSLGLLTLSSEGNASSRRPRLAMNGEGNAIAVWEAFNGTNYLIERAFLPSGGSWSEPVALSAAGEDALYAKVIMNSEGGIASCWQRFNGSTFTIQGEMLPFGQGGEGVLNLSNGATNTYMSSIGIDDQGNAFAVWAKIKAPSTFVTVAATYNASLQEWGSPSELSSTSSALVSPQIAVNGNGKAMAVWQLFNGKNLFIQAAICSGGTWSAPTTLSSTAQNGTRPHVAIDDTGRGMVVWQGTEGDQLAIQAIFLSAEGVWGTIVNVSSLEWSAFNPQVAADSSGQFVVIWQALQGTNYAIQTARFSSGEWGAPTALATASSSLENPRVALNGLGEGLAVWQLKGESTVSIQASSLSMEAWSAAQTISDSTGNATLPQVGIDSGGNGVALWQANLSPSPRIQAAVFTSGEGWGAYEAIDTVDIQPAQGD